MLEPDYHCTDMLKATDRNPKWRRPTRLNGRPCARRMLRQISTAGDCMLSFAAFLEEAKPAEIRLLGDMLAEWQNWGGSLRAGNFFGAVAESVLHHNAKTRLKAWPQDRRKMAAAEAEIRQARTA